MNSHIPFDANNDWTLDPYHCNQSNDPLVDKVIGNAYAVVRAVYCNLGNLKLLYDFLNTYGMVIGVKSEAELKKLNKLVKYARIYGYSSTNDRQVTDYLYVPDDTSGIRPDDPTATGSWIKVATSATGGGGEGTGQGSYIPYVYANGSALGGETSFKVPEGTVGVPFLIINGSVQYVGYGFTYAPATATVTLSNPLVQGDEVVALTTAVPANPDNPEVPGWVQVNWLYNNGSAVGGEQVITVPYNFDDVPAVYKNGLRLYKGLQNNSYVIDKDTHTITMTEILAQGDRVIITLGGESETLTVIDRTLQEVARANDVKDSDVVFSSNTNVVITGKKIIYDVVAQKAWALPDLPPNAYIVKVEGNQLTYNPGKVTVTLLSTYQKVNSQALWKRSLAEAGLILLSGSFEEGAKITLPTQVLLYEATGKHYRWDGTIPSGGKDVPPGSTPTSSGGIDSGAWVNVDEDYLRNNLSANDGFKLIGTVPSMAALKTQKASFDGQLIQLRSWNAGLNLGGGIFQWDAASTKPDDSGCVVQVTGVSTGRWIRQGVVDKTPEMFGAIGNGINDDTTSLQAMFNSANNSQILGENFFGTFDLRHKYKTTESLNCGRPIKVDAYGAEFICTGSYPCVNFAMHNGEWSGGYFNYETLTDAQVNENAIAMQLIPNEVAPISVQNSIIKGLRIWGAHTGIGFKNDTGAEIWGLIFESMEIGIRPGISSVKAKGLSFEGKGGSTTISCRNINIHRRGSSIGAGSTAFFSIGVNEVDYYNVAYDGFFDEELGYCKVGPKEIFDVTAFRCNVIGFHTEKLYIDVDTFGECPMFFNCNSFSITGVEHLATYGTRGAAWMTIAGNNVATVGTWHELSSLSPQVNARVVNLLEWDRSGMINLTGNVKESDIIGGASRIPLYSPGPSSYGTNRDVTGPSGTIIFDLNTDYSAMVITAVGHQVSSTDLSFMSTIQLHYNPTGGWQVSHQTTKSQNFSAAVMNYGVSGNQLVFLLSGNTNDFRIQCRVETLRSLLTSF